MRRRLALGSSREPSEGRRLARPLSLGRGCTACCLPLGPVQPSSSSPGSPRPSPGPPYLYLTPFPPLFPVGPISASARPEAADQRGRGPLQKMRPPLRGCLLQEQSAVLAPGHVRRRKRGASGCEPLLPRVAGSPTRSLPSSPATSHISLLVCSERDLNEVLQTTTIFTNVSKARSSLASATWLCCERHGLRQRLPRLHSCWPLPVPGRRRQLAGAEGGLRGGCSSV